jgi:hypothetical protein
MPALLASEREQVTNSALNRSISSVGTIVTGQRFTGLITVTARR